MPAGGGWGRAEGEDGGSGQWALAFGAGTGPRPWDAEGDSAGTQGARSHRVAVAEDAEGRGGGIEEPTRAEFACPPWRGEPQSPL